MSFKQMVMNFIMSGRCIGIKVKEIGDNEQNTIHANYFLYHGDYFDAYSDQAMLKNLFKISLVKIDGVVFAENGDCLISYSDGNGLLLLSKKH